MEVQVLHRLTRIGTAVGDDTVSVFNPCQLGKLSQLLEDVGDDGTVVSIDGIYTGNVLLWNDQEMYGSNRRNIVERQNLLILVQLLGWDFPIDDFTEQTIGNKMTSL